MTEQEKEQLRDRIVSQIEEINNMVGSHRESSKPVAPDNAIGRLTRMEAISAKHISEASLNSARNRLLGLENALVRIDTDEDYGLCIECEEPLPVKRLMLMPEALRCVRCADR